MELMDTIYHFMVSSYRGIDGSVMEQGGLKCYNFLTIKQRMVDTLAYIVFALVVVAPIVVRKLSFPPPQQRQIVDVNSFNNPSYFIVGFRKWLLLAICLVFGAELGFKLAKETWIYVLNVCHVITTVQIYLLSAQPSRLCTSVFRIHVHLLFPAFFAIMFPSTSQRTYTGEVLVFWLQHILIFFVIPFYLLWIGGPYTCEPLSDIAWPMLSVLVIGFYMYFITQGVGMLTMVNLTTILCPAPSDPFYGPYYRICALVVTVAFTLVSGKLYFGIARSLIRAINFFSKNQGGDSVAATDEDKTK